MDICQQEKKILQNRMNIIKSHPSDAVFELDGKKGFIAQKKGAVVHIIKCTSSDASYRHIEEDTEEIPVLHKGRAMFADPVTFVLKPNARNSEWNLPANQIENRINLIL